MACYIIFLSSIRIERTKKWDVEAVKETRKFATINFIFIYYPPF